MSVWRRRGAKRSREAISDSTSNRWTTVGGDTAEVFPARATPGHPQRWYWRVVAPNGQKIAASGQGFTRPRSARRALARTFPPADGAQ